MARGRHEKTRSHVLSTCKKITHEAGLIKPNSRMRLANVYDIHPHCTIALPLWQAPAQGNTLQNALRGRAYRILWC